MAENTNISLAVLFAVIALVVWGNLRLLCFARVQLTTNPSLQMGLTLVCVPALLSGVTSLVGIIIPVWSGGWHLGVPACEIFGLVDNVLSGAANWMLTLVIIERYVKQNSPTEHSATFTERNLRLLAVGVFLLQLMLTTGPFYGLGEYNYYRGKLPVTISFNVTSRPLYSTECKGFLSAYILVTRHLRYDTLSAVSEALTSEFKVIGRSSWSPEGIVFLLRMSGQPALRKLMGAMQSGQLQRKLSECIFTQDVRAVFQQLPQLQVVVDAADVERMKSVYLPVQALGLCGMDFTSTNRHAAAGLAYIFTACTPLPFALALVAILAIHKRLCTTCLPYEEPQPETKWDLLFVAALKVTAVVGAIGGFLYLALNLSLATERAVQPTWVLWGTLSLTFPRAALYVAWCLGQVSLLQSLRDSACRCLHAVLRWRRRKTYQTRFSGSHSRTSNPCAV